MSSQGTSPEPARVVKTAGRTLYTVQALRAVAAAMVVAHHATVMIGWRIDPQLEVWENGQAGVDIFFVISGLVMTLSSEPLLCSAHGARTFLLRRVERVVPLYWLLTTVKVALVLLAPAVSVNGGETWWHITASYLFLPVLGPAGYYPVLIAGWTLNFEMVFYLLFALAIAMAARVRPLRFLIPVLCLLAALPWLLGDHLWFVLTFLFRLPLVLEFLFGVLLAKAVQMRRLPGAGISAMLVLCGFVLLLMLPVGAYRMLLWGVPAAMIVTGAVGLEGRIGKKLPTWLLELGDSSYSLYLTHTLVLPAVAALTIKMHAGSGVSARLWAAAAIVLCFAVGEVCYRGLELPIVRYFKGRRRAAVPAVANQTA